MNTIEADKWEFIHLQCTMYNLSVRNDSAAKLYIVNCLIVNELNYHFQKSDK